MTISEDAVTRICEVLEITRNLELDELLILSHAVIEQTKIKSNLRGPKEVIFLNLGNRFNRRIREGYVPDDAKGRIEQAIQGGS